MASKQRQQDAAQLEHKSRVLNTRNILSTHVRCMLAYIVRLLNKIIVTEQIKAPFFVERYLVLINICLGALRNF